MAAAPDPPPWYAWWGWAKSAMSPLPDGSWMVVPQVQFGITGDDMSLINYVLGQDLNVRLVPGTYTAASPIIPVSGGRVLGPGPLETTIQASGTSLVSVTGQTDSFELSNVTLAMPGGQAFDIFSGASAARWFVHDCRFTQNNAGNAIWRGTTSAGQSMVECRFRRNTWQVFGATRTAEAIFLSSASGATQINANSWRDEVFFNENNDTAMYLIHLQNTGALNQTNYFENIVFEHPYGGAIWLESHTNGYINQCYCYDLPSGTATITNPLIKVSKNSTGPASARTTIIGGPRIQSGAVFAAGVGDINLDASCSDTVLEALSASGQLQLYLGGSKGVKLLGMPDGGWGIQDSPVTAAAGSAAGTGPPAPVVSAGPDNQSGLITFGTGMAPSAGQMVTVTFGTPFESTPQVAVVPYNGASTGLGLFSAVLTSTGFEVDCQNAPLASEGSAFYGFRWFAWI